MQEPDAKTMTLWEHLEEFRWVLFKSAAALAATTVASLIFVGRVMELLRLPVQRLGPKVELVFGSPMDGFMIQFKMALLAGFVLALPFMLYFLWGFVSPALHERERRMAVRVIGAGVLLFLLGAGFGYGLLFFTLPVLLSFGIEGVRQLWSFREYIDFSFALILGTGVVFEFPLVLLILVWMGILSVDLLRKGRQYAVVIILVVSAVVTPSTDIVTQCILGVPLWVLYELTILAASAMPRRETGDDDESDETKPDAIDEDVHER